MRGRAGDRMMSSPHVGFGLPTYLTAIPLTPNPSPALGRGVPNSRIASSLPGSSQLFKFLQLLLRKILLSLQIKGTRLQVM